MDEKKKLLKIIIVVFCLCLALIITVFFSRSKKYGVQSISGKIIWVTCTECQAEYQMDAAEYYKFLEDNSDYSTQTVLRPPCRECGRNAIYEKELLTGGGQ